MVGWSQGEKHYQYFASYIHIQNLYKSIIPPNFSCFSSLSHLNLIYLFYFSNLSLFIVKFIIIYTYYFFYRLLFLHKPFSILSVRSFSSSAPPKASQSLSEFETIFFKLKEKLRSEESFGPDLNIKAQITTTTFYKNWSNIPMTQGPFVSEPIHSAYTHTRTRWNPQISSSPFYFPRLL